MNMLYPSVRTNRSPLTPANKYRKLSLVLVIAATLLSAVGQFFSPAATAAGKGRGSTAGSLAPKPASAQVQAAGNVIHEYWLNVAGGAVGSIPLNSPTSGTATLTSLETPSNWADNYGSRIRGYITAPQTGSYTFWIASDDNGELWLSPNDQPAGKTRIAFVGDWTGSREWGKFASQKSSGISLNAGQTYYFEVLQKDGGGGDNLAVGWSKPGQSTGSPSEIVPGSVLSPVAIAGPIGERARQSDEFVESMGVNVHLGYTDSVYGRYSDVIKPRLQELGIRHIRDGIDPTRNDVTSKLQDLNGTAGIKSTLMASFGAHLPAAAYNYVKNQVGVQAVTAVEGINEPDLFLNSCCWAAQTRAYHQQMYQAFKNDPATAQLPVIAPSITTTQAVASIGELTASADAGNLHNYYGGRMPETPGWGDNGYGSLNWGINYVARPLVRDKPVYSTETGYHNAANTTDGHRYTPEGVAARYIPRLFLHHFNGGVVKTFAYELIDYGTNSTDIHDNFGLLRNNNTVKPAFTAVKNLIAVLSDRGAAFAPGALDYTLTGNTSDVRHTLLQKRDGKFYLVLWVAAQRWNPDTRVETDVPAQSVSVQLTTPMQRARTFVPLNSPAAVQDQPNPTVISVSVPDHPVIIELTPSATGTPTTEITTGIYRLLSGSGNKALDVAGASVLDGGDVIQWSQNGGTNQQWLVERLADGDYRLTAMHSNKTLDVAGAGSNDGANVIQWSRNDGPNQKWQVVSVGNGYYKLLPRHAPGKVLDVRGSSAADGADVQIWTDNGSAGQRWRFEPVN